MGTETLDHLMKISNSSCPMGQFTSKISFEPSRYHARLAELLAIKKGETYSTTGGIDPGKSIVCSTEGAILCLRGSRGNRNWQQTFMSLILKLKEDLPFLIDILYN